MTIKLTIRLEEDEKQLLELIQEQSGKNTINAVVKMMIQDWQKLQDEREQWQELSEQLDGELRDLKRAVQAKFTADQALASLVSDDVDMEPSFTEFGQCSRKGLRRHLEDIPDFQVDDIDGNHFMAKAGAGQAEENYGGRIL